jgi:hypothetical protein
MCGGRRQCHGPTCFSSTTGKRDCKVPVASELWVCPELRYSIIISVDVTPHRFILIRSGMRIPSASVYQPPPDSYLECQRTTTKAIHWTEPRITTIPFPLVSAKRKPPKFAVLSGPPVSLGSFLEPVPTGLLCGGDPCKTRATHPAALSGYDIKFRRFGAGCLAAPRCSDWSAWFALCTGETGCMSQEGLRLLQS